MFFIFLSKRAIFCNVFLIFPAWGKLFSKCCLSWIHLQITVDFSKIFKKFCYADAQKAFIKDSQAANAREMAKLENGKPKPRLKANNY